ncbi:GABA-specific permease [Trichomonascus vanleenenianus]|uniref:Uga4p n=1 Tax=Trichomonascus vanleenenianus TaxID=2268995 RepID=UPI003ECA5872
MSEQESKVVLERVESFSPSVEKGILVDRDNELLEELGYKAELNRNFSSIEVFGIAFSIMSLLPSIAASMSYALPAGPVGMTWGWLCASVCILLVGISMAEMGSANPTSGGLYFCTFKFAPEKVKKPLCFLAGYSNTLGLIGATCSIDYGASLMLLSLPAIAYEGFVPNKYQTYGVFVGILITHCVIGSIATKVISKLQGFCIITNMVIIIVTIIALPVATGKEELNSAHYVFTHTENLTGWPSGWAFFMAWMSPIWTIGAFDSCIHMAEEAKNAAVAVPFGIVGSIAVCGVLGFAINAVIAACMGTDIAAILDNPYGQPMAAILNLRLGKSWTIGIMTILLIVQWFMGLSCVVAASRQTWAFSRDGALPFSNILRVVNYKLGVPLRALWFVCFIAAIVGMLCLVNPAATNALFSLAVTSNGLSWGIPIFCRTIWWQEDFRPGPFYLGKRWSRIIGALSCTYLVFAITILAMFPSAGPDVTADNMNYTCAINGAVWSGALLYYYIDARKWFEGPKLTINE